MYSLGGVLVVYLLRLYSRFAVFTVLNRYSVKPAGVSPNSQATAA